MRKITYLILVLIFKSFSCTSFACYSEEIWYGMNFDFPQKEMNFSIIDLGDKKVFRMAFIQNGKCFVYGYNSDGVLSTVQMRYPQSSFVTPGVDEISFFDAWIYASHNFTNMNSFKEYLQTGGENGNGIKVVQTPPLTIHTLNVDKTGYGFVLEDSDNGNEYTEVLDGKLVMSNFLNYQFAGQPYNNVSGVGADRFKYVSEYLEENFDDFNYDNAWQALQGSIQSSGSYKTLCSSIFDPENNNIYIVLNRDFSKIWKISLTSSTIETYSGFENFWSTSLDDDGISSNTLLSLTDLNEQLPAKSKLSVYPNPFNPTTTVKYELTNSSNVLISIFDSNGSIVKKFNEGFKSIGKHEITLNCSDFTSGVYYLKLETLNHNLIKSLTLIK
ncbi:MAG: T9SS type A sorting domain-containing protein [Candidatus Delongbacteria bacterium]|nr:T9SS type A sorting domain-containing protein [Candidatus Delongbacteria bacterium]MBN2833655.1 T9SS type A sorting domain-containing protein [Candidatus Delongbacteria bacterium]